jgi:hypothetical protein
MRVPLITTSQLLPDTVQADRLLSVAPISSRLIADELSFSKLLKGDLMARSEKVHWFITGVLVVVVTVLVAVSSRHECDSVGRYQVTSVHNNYKTKLFVLDTRTSELAWMYAYQENMPKYGRQVMIPQTDNQD